MEKLIKIIFAAISVSRKHALTFQGALERAHFYSPLAYLETLYKLISSGLPSMLHFFKDSGQHVSNATRAPLLQKTVRRG